MLRINGFRWTVYAAIYVLIRKFRPTFTSTFLDTKLRRLEEKKGSQGMNDLELNKKIWERWNWRGTHGEEWTWSEAWKESIIDQVMKKYIKMGSNILEVGPGGGKWSVPLSKLADSLTLVDISEACLTTCKTRLGDKSFVRFILGSGTDFPEVPDGTIDYIWSFDVFVHISPQDIRSYLAEMKRVLKPGGRAIIHHASSGGRAGGWRSRLKKAEFNDFLSELGFTLINQFDSWGDKGEFDVKKYEDMISVFEKRYQKVSLNGAINSNALFK